MMIFQRKTGFIVLLVIVLLVITSFFSFGLRILMHYGKLLASSVFRISNNDKTQVPVPRSTLHRDLWYLKTATALCNIY